MTEARLGKDPGSERSRREVPQGAGRARAGRGRQREPWARPAGSAGKAGRASFMRHSRKKTGIGGVTSLRWAGTRRPGFSKGNFNAERGYRWAGVCTKEQGKGTMALVLLRYWVVWILGLWTLEGRGSFTEEEDCWSHRHSIPLSAILEKEVNIHWRIQSLTSHYLPQSKIKLFVKA